MLLILQLLILPRSGIAAAEDIWLHLLPQNTGPGLRKGFSAVQYGPDGAAIFGGSSAAGGKLYSDVTTLNAETMAWEQPVLISGVPPSPRADHAAVGWAKLGAALHGTADASPAAASVGAMIIFGGSGHDGLPLNDVHYFDLVNNKWFKPTIDVAMPAPPPRSRSAAVLSGAGSNTMVVVGGRTKTGFVCDVWRLELDPMWRWDEILTQGAAPPVRADHTAVPWTTPGGVLSLVVFGGTADAKCFNDVAVLDLHLLANVWTTVTPTGTSPPARRSHSAALRGAAGSTQVMVIFGGISSSGAALGDAWVLTLAGEQSTGYQFAWAPLVVTGGGAPSARGGVRAVSWGFDRILFFGGFTINAAGAERVVDDVYALGPQTPHPTPFPTMSPTTEIPTTTPTMGPHFPTQAPTSGAAAAAQTKKTIVTVITVFGSLCVLCIVLTACCVAGNVIIVPRIMRRIRQNRERFEQPGLNGNSLGHSRSSSRYSLGVSNDGVYERMDDGGGGSTTAGASADILRSLQQQRRSDSNVGSMLAGTLDLLGDSGGSFSGRSFSGQSASGRPNSGSDAGLALSPSAGSGEVGLDSSHHRRVSSEAAILEFQRSWDETEARPPSALLEPITSRPGSERSSGVVQPRHERSASELMRSMTDKISSDPPRGSK